MTESSPSTAPEWVMETIHVVPAGREWLSYRCEKPADWKQADLPQEEPDFSDPTVFLPLSIWVAEYGIVVFSIAARPAFDSGAVAQWAEWLAGEQKIRLTGRRTINVGELAALVYEGEQDADAGPMRVRLMFIEDGKRLFVATCMAHQQLWAGVDGLFDQMLASFRLDEVRGAARNLTVNQAADVALAEDAASLDPEQEMNARLRNNGVGLTPRVLDVNLGEKYAVIGAGAIGAVVRVPLGWHVMDDGRRTLVFDAGGRMQINMDLRPDMAEDQAIAGLVGQFEAEQPGIRHVRFAAAGLEAVAFSGMLVNGETLEQCFLLRRGAGDGQMLVTRVTANQQDIRFALNAAEVLVTSVGAMQ